MALTNAEIVTQLYVGYYNRAPDPEGLNYWIGRLNAGVSQADVANSFATSPEAIATYPFFAFPELVSAEAFLTQVYQNLFGRAIDADGLAYYTGKLTSGATPVGQILAEIIGNAATNEGSADQKYLANKVTVGLDWANTAANTPAFTFDAAAKSSAGSILTGVTADAATVTAAEAKTDAFFGSIITGETFTLTVGLDNIVGTNNNDLIKVLATNPVTGAAATTWGSSDTIDGGAGTDTLSVEVNGANNAILYSTTNVEVIKIDNSNATTAAAHAGGSVVDASKFDGATNIEQSVKAAGVTNLAATTTASFKNVDTNVALTAAAADTVTSVKVNLDGVKDSSDNTSALNVSGKALNSVTVSGTLAAVDAVKEVFKAAFSAAVDADTVAFDGVTFTATAGDTAIQVAAAFATYYNAQTAAKWVAVDNADGTVTFTAKTAGAVDDVDSSDFVVTSAGGGADVTVSVAAPTTDGVKSGANLALGVTAGADVEAVSVNTAVATTLTVTDGTGTKKVSSVDASASAGAITYAAASTVGAIKTGSGADKVTVTTATTATLNAVVDTGAGNDEITVNTTGTGKTTINAGAGDDKIILLGGLKTSTIIDGGEGNDTLSLKGKVLIAEDYVLFNNTIKNVENVEFTDNTAAASVDASKLAFTGYTFAGNAADKITEASAVTITTKANIEALATGYKADGTDADVLTDAQGGNLNITSTGSGTVKAYGTDLTLAVKAGAAADNAVTLSGDVLTANIALTNSGSAAAGDKFASISITTGDATIAPVANDYLNKVTLTGNGSATIDNSAGTKLVTVDASGLGGTIAFGANAGNVTGGLEYTASGSVAETITLGSGQDTIILAAGGNVYSTYEKMDTIIGFDAVKETNDSKSTTDILKIGGITLDGTVAAQATKVTLSASATTLDLAFVEAAAATTEAATKPVFFQFDGNTYIFAENATAVGHTENLDSTDFAVKIVGLVDFASTWGVYSA